jgi:predicted hotdog family 3-hydroxylacyl-ACP dehydratase
MCLLDAVLRWDPLRIECASGTHRALDHPLRAYGRLGAACTLEYAAQAMAVHGALLQPSAAARSRFGMLTSARELALYVSRLDDIADELIICATRTHLDQRAALYSFTVAARQGLLAEGRASLLLDAAHSPAIGGPLNAVPPSAERP